MSQEQPTSHFSNFFKRLFGPGKETAYSNTQAEKSLEPKQVWKRLSEIQQRICIQFSVMDWQIGLEKRLIDQLLPELPASWSDIEMLVQDGVIEAQPAAVYSQQWLDANSLLVAKYDELQTNHAWLITPQEKVVIRKISQHRATVEKQNPTLRYRIRDESFRDWIMTEFAGNS